MHCPTNSKGDLLIFVHLNCVHLSQREYSKQLGFLKKRRRVTDILVSINKLVNKMDKPNTGLV